VTPHEEPKRIAIMGGMNSGALVLDAILSLSKLGQASMVGFLNDAYPADVDICGFPVLGTLDSWQSLDPTICFIGAMQNPDAMIETASRIVDLGIPADRWASVIHPSAVISESATISPGAYVGPLVSVMPRARIGWNTSVRGGCYVSHDVIIGCHCHLGANSVIGGHTKIGEAVFVGALAFVKNDLTIEDAAHIAPGAAVFRSMPKGARGVGNPMRVTSGNER